MERLCYHYTKLTVNFSFIAEPHMKLCLIKVAKSDACIRPLFANLVTYYGSIQLGVLISHLIRSCTGSAVKYLFSIDIDRYRISIVYGVQSQRYHPLQYTGKPQSLFANISKALFCQTSVKIFYYIRIEYSRLVMWLVPGKT